MKHKLKRIFNSLMHRRAFSRALITVITCSIIFSYSVLCPQAESSSLVFYPDVEYSASGEGNKQYSPPNLDYWGKSVIDNINFDPAFYWVYDPTQSGVYESKVFCFVDTTYENDNVPLGSVVDVSFSFYVPSLDDYNQNNSSRGYMTFFNYDGQEVYLRGVSTVVSTPVVDDFTGATGYVNEVHYIFDTYTEQTNSDFIPDVLSYELLLPIYHPGQNVSFDVACAVMSSWTVSYAEDADIAVVLDGIYQQTVTNGALISDINNTLTEVTPELQESINKLETLIQDEQEKIEDVITEMDKIDTDFGTQIGDFDYILNDNAGTLEDIGSTTYNSFINDVFGNWFFVSMFALFGAFAFFSRAVFG